MSHKHVFISLGAACDSAMMLNNVGLRKQSYPFDWLWNLRGGLNNVEDMIMTDFHSSSSTDSYIRGIHYRFSERVLIYNKYPDIVHLHSDPLAELSEHSKLCSRAIRFNNEIQSSNIKHFIYYRNHNENIISKKTTSVESSVILLVSEGKNFLQQMELKYPNVKEKINLILILQVDSEQLVLARRLIKNELNKFDNYVNLTVHCMLARNDGNRKLHLIWNLQWINILFKLKHVPFFVKARAIFQGTIRLMYLSLKNYL